MKVRFFCDLWEYAKEYKLPIIPRIKETVIFYDIEYIVRNIKHDYFKNCIDIYIEKLY